MSKIIVHNLSKRTDLRALQAVGVVMSGGFVSGDNQYCWITTFPGVGIEVHAMNTKGKTHTFKVVDHER